jgi:sirohydrochlorin cobaltochelatase
MNTQQGILMVAHGARAAGWDAPFQTVIASLRAREDGVRYALSFLENKLPATAGAVSELAAQGCTHITLVPMLLGIGAHAREDLPALLAAAQAAHPHITFKLSRTLGEDALILHAMEVFVSAQVV